jgi:hypothetical protein
LGSAERELAAAITEAHRTKEKEKAIGHTHGDANANTLGVFFFFKLNGKTQDNRAILISEISSTAGFGLIVNKGFAQAFVDSLRLSLPHRLQTDKIMQS